MESILNVCALPQCANDKNCDLSVFSFIIDARTLASKLYLFIQQCVLYNYVQVLLPANLCLVILLSSEQCSKFEGFRLQHVQMANKHPV